MTADEYDFKSEFGKDIIPKKLQKHVYTESYPSCGVELIEDFMNIYAPKAKGIRSWND